MLKHGLIGLAVAALAVAPCAAARFPEAGHQGARNTGAFAGAYLRVPLGRAAAREQRQPELGLRLSVVHDYRDAKAPSARVASVDALNVALAGKTTTLRLAGIPLSGHESQRLNAMSTGETIAVVVAGVVVVGLAGLYLVASSVSDDD